MALIRSSKASGSLPTSIDSFEIYTGTNSVTMSKDGLAYVWCQDNASGYSATLNGNAITFDSVVSVTASNTYPCAVVPVKAGDVLAYVTPAGKYVNIMLGV